MRAWDELDPAWRAAFELAWEAYSAGSIPVGAVVTREEAIVARGRNRLFEIEAPAGEVAGTRIAHAEMNALAHLPLDKRYYDCVLSTTLEPCAMCIGAAWVGTIGVVRYAGADVYAGSAKLIEAQLERTDRARHDPLPVEGPVEGPFGVLGELLHVAWFLHRRPQHRVTEIFRERCPDVVALAERALLDEHVGAPLEETLPSFFEALR